MSNEQPQEVNDEEKKLLKKIEKLQEEMAQKEKQGSVDLDKIIFGPGNDNYGRDKQRYRSPFAPFGDDFGNHHRLIGGDLVTMSMANAPQAATSIMACDLATSTGK